MEFIQLTAFRLHGTGKPLGCLMYQIILAEARGFPFSHSAAGRDSIQIGMVPSRNITRRPGWSVSPTAVQISQGLIYFTRLAQRMCMPFMQRMQQLWQGIPFTSYHSKSMRMGGLRPTLIIPTTCFNTLLIVIETQTLLLTSGIQMQEAAICSSG